MEADNSRNQDLDGRLLIALVRADSQQEPRRRVYLVPRLAVWPVLALEAALKIDWGSYATRVWLVLWLVALSPLWVTLYRNL